MRSKRIAPPAGQSVTRQAIGLRISRGSAHCAPRQVPEADLKVMHRIDRLHVELPLAGGRMLQGLLVQQGFYVRRQARWDAGAGSVICIAESHAPARDLSGGAVGIDRMGRRQGHEVLP